MFKLGNDYLNFLLILSLGVLALTSIVFLTTQEEPSCEYDFDVKSVNLSEEELYLETKFNSEPVRNFSFSSTIITEDTGVVLTDREKYNSDLNQTYSLGFDFKSFAVNENITHITNTISPDNCKENVKIEIYQPFGEMKYKACKNKCEGSEDIFNNF